MLPPAADADRMADAWDGQALLGGGGREKGPGAAEQDFFQLPSLKLVQKLRTEHHRTAPAAGAACVNILLDGVVDQIPAVRQLPADGESILPAKGHQRLHPDGPQIPGDDQIIVIGRGSGVLKMGPDGVICSWGHGGPHIGGIRDAQVRYRADGGGFDGYAAFLRGHQSRPGACDGPLGRGGPLAAVAQGEAVLPLGPGEVAGGHGGHMVGIAAAHHQGGEQEALGHGCICIGKAMAANIKNSLF